jgi:prevent-host-death family protein
MPKNAKKPPRARPAKPQNPNLKPAGQSWQIQTAKARFSEVFRLARTEGPQRITRQGKDGVVMISDDEYQRLVGKSHQPASLVEFFRASPLAGVELDLDRAKDEGREVEL